MDNIISAALFKELIISGANNLSNKKTEVDELNVFPVPDGDTGTNMSMTFSAAAREIEIQNPQTVKEIGALLVNASLRGARGNSGVILSQLLRGFSKALGDCTEIDVKTLARALANASVTAYKAVMKPTEGTILTVARETANYALEICETKEDIKEFAEAVVQKAKEVLNKTPEMLPVLKQAGVVDAGGMGLYVVLEGALSALLGNPVFLNETESASYKGTAAPKRNDIDTAEIKFLYCTEFIINKHSKNSSVLNFRETISKIGDCMLVIDDEEIVKVHIHTNNPGFVIEQAVKIGELTNIKIDNMKYQHEEGEVSKTEEAKPENEENPLTEEVATEEAEEKEYGFVCISAGEGFSDLFLELGVDKTVTGGQSMNPSTEDILKAVNLVNAKNIFVFPNNKNIILAASQVGELTEKNIVVIPTKTIPQGITAILNFDETQDVNANEAAMNESLQTVKTGSVTFAARDSEMEGLTIKKDDIMGMEEGKITYIGSDANEVAAKIIDNMVDSETSVISIYYGEEIAEEKAEILKNFAADKYSDSEVVMIKGGQPLYYYIIAVE